MIGSIVTANLKEQIDNDILNLKSGGKLESYFDSMAEFHGYSYGNVLLIKKRYPEAKFVSTPETWQNQFGRQVKDKSIEILILVPDTIKKTITKTKRDGKGNFILDENSRIVEARDELTIPYMKPLVVFDISQTDGKAFDIDFVTHNSDVSSKLIFQSIANEMKNMDRYEWEGLNNDSVKAAVMEAITHVTFRYYNLNEPVESKLSNVEGWLYGKDISEIKRFLEIVQRKSYNTVEEINHKRGKRMNEMGGEKYAEHSLNI